MTLITCKGCGQSCDDVPIREGRCVGCWFKKWNPQIPDTKIAPPPAPENVNEWPKAGKEGKP